MERRRKELSCTPEIVTFYHFVLNAMISRRLRQVRNHESRYRLTQQLHNYRKWLPVRIASQRWSTQRSKISGTFCLVCLWSKCDCAHGATCVLANTATRNFAQKSICVEKGPQPYLTDGCLITRQKSDSVFIIIYFFFYLC